MTRFYKKIKKLPWQWGVLLLFVCVLAGGVPLLARAQMVDSLGRTIANVVASIGFLLIQHVLGYLVITMVNILIWISGYNDFANSLAVVNGWVVVRDIANMFFIIILLIVAIATILGQEEYHYKKLLPKLVVMALLINFSRTIAGLMIDVAQVVMITFVNGYSAAAGGNFANALRITEILKLNQGYFGQAINEYQLAGAAIFGVIILLISNIVITVLVAVLAFRIIMLWLLIVLSPIAWLMGTFPQGQKYYVKWWDEFRDQVVVGPALAFFLWLSLATVGSGKAFDQVSGGRSAPTGEGSSVGISQISTMDSIISFIISIGMLLAGLQVGQEMGGAIAGVMSKAKTAAVNSMKLGAKVGVGALSFAERKQAMITGIGVNPFRYVEKFKSIWERRKMMEEAMIAATGGKKAEQLAAGTGRIGGLFGGRVGAVMGVARMAMGSPADFFDNYMGWRGVKRFYGALAGGGKAAREKEHEAEELQKERKRMYTKKDIDGMKEGIEKEGATLANLTDNKVTANTINLKEESLQKMVEEYSKVLKKDEKSLRVEGKIKEADALKEDIDVMDVAVQKGGVFAYSQSLKNKEVEAGFRGRLVDVMGKGALADNVVDLADKQDVNREMMMNIYKSLKKEAGTLKTEGFEDEATEVSEQAETLKSALGARGKFNFGKVPERLKKEILEKLGERLKNAQEDINKFELTIKEAKVFDTADAKKKAVEEITGKIMKLQRQAALRTAPRAVYAAENFRHLEAEESKGMPQHEMEATEVLEELNSALVEKNKVKFSAWMKKAAQDYNDNEVWNGFGYDGSVEGVHKFRKEVLVDKLGMTEQESKGLVNDICYINEGKGHYNISRMYSVKHGVFEENSPEVQAAIVLNENLKKDSRKFSQNTNRLGYGYETADGKYRLDKSGLATLVAEQFDFMARMNKNEFNNSALNKIGEAIDQLEDLERKGLLWYKDSQGRNLRELVKQMTAKGQFRGGATFDKMRSVVRSV